MKAPRANVRDSDWHQRRALLLHAACHEIARATESGAPVLATIRRISRRFHGRSLRNGRRLHCKMKTLVCQWYRWKSAPTPDAFRLCYQPGRPRVPRGPLLRKALECVERGWSASTGWKLTNRRRAAMPCSFQTFRRTVPMERIARIAELQRQLENERAEARREIQARLAQLKAEDTP